MQYLLTKEEVEKLPNVTACKILIEFSEAVTPLTSRCLATTTMDKHEIDRLVSSVTDKLQRVATRYGVDFADYEGIYKRMLETGEIGK